MSIELKNINKKYGEFNALSGINLSVAEGELLAILGPSGSGKTTLLRIIAGLEMPDSGAIFLSGEESSGISARDRRIGFVFQHYAMFKHMTVGENVAFGLKVKPRNMRLADKAISERVDELLNLVQLGQYKNRYPHQLSGGQRQRVALARVLAINPKVLLLDEPFGALDATVRKDLRRWLVKLHDEMNVTSILVTHDQEEAMEVAARVVVMNKGRIEQSGAPEEIYAKPANPFVFSFLGNANRFDCIISKGQALVTGEDGALQLKFSHQLIGDERKCVGFIRPHQFHLALEPDEHSFKAVIVSVNPAGSFVKFDARTEQGVTLSIETPHEKAMDMKISKGSALYLTPTAIKLFDL